VRVALVDAAKSSSLPGSNPVVKFRESFVASDATSLQNDLPIADRSKFYRV